jgi:hypothetical protein
VLVPYFLLFCIRNILRIGRNNSQNSYFSDMRRSPKQRRRGARGQPHHRVARPSPWPRHQVVGPHGPPPDTALPPIYSPRQENPKPPINFLENILQAATIIDARSGGSRSSSRTLPERGITTGGLLHHHACLWSDV